MQSKLVRSRLTPCEHWGKLSSGDGEKDKNDENFSFGTSFVT